tara:strand:+ start:112 stop:312 length:201 start_codon:yes stop_codon:yes gene_type:complete
MTTKDLKTLKITELRKVLKTIIVWDINLIKKCSREIIISSIERYEDKSSPKHNLFMENLSVYNNNN